MGNELFGIDIAGIITDAMADSFPDVTITRYVRGDRVPGNLTGGQPATPETVTCKGFWEDFTGTPPPGVALQINDRKAILFGDTIEAGGQPLKNDKITIHEDVGDSSLFMVQLLRRDPAAATYTYLCRDRLGTDGV